MYKRVSSLIVVACFFLTTLGPLPNAHADSVLGLPAPGTMVNLSPAYEPVIIKGLTVHKDNPFLFDFIVDVGQDKMSGEPLKKEGEKLIKYFLASLAIPDKDVWVNLSPYEKNRMIPEVLGQTDMGRDLLEQDYILKQITASLIYPEKQLGKIFWDKVYTKAQEMYGTTQVPVNTFNKVWIMADRAEVFEHNQTAFVVDSHLKVMLEEDYLALQKQLPLTPSLTKEGERKSVPPLFFKEGARGSSENIHTLSSQIIRQIILPQLEKEVNTGRNFANLRQIFNSIILSSWFKRNLKQALLNQVYANKSKVKGVKRPNSLDGKDLSPKQIYEQYLKAYKKGVFNYIKEDINTANGETIPRKYFSGGIMRLNPVLVMTTDPAMLGPLQPATLVDFATLASPNKNVITFPSNSAKTDGEQKKVNKINRELVRKSILGTKVVLYSILLGVGIWSEIKMRENGFSGNYIYWKIAASIGSFAGGAYGISEILNRFDTILKKNEPTADSQENIHFPSKTKKLETQDSGLEVDQLLERLKVRLKPLRKHLIVAKYEYDEVELIRRTEGELPPLDPDSVALEIVKALDAILEAKGQVYTVKKFNLEIISLDKFTNINITKAADEEMVSPATSPAMVTAATHDRNVIDSVDTSIGQLDLIKSKNPVVIKAAIEGIINPYLLGELDDQDLLGILERLKEMLGIKKEEAQWLLDASWLTAAYDKDYIFLNYLNSNLTEILHKKRGIQKVLSIGEEQASKIADDAKFLHRRWELVEEGKVSGREFAVVNLKLSPLPVLVEGEEKIDLKKLVQAWRAADRPTIYQFLGQPDTILLGKSQSITDYLNGQLPFNEKINFIDQWRYDAAWIILKHKLGNKIEDLVADDRILHLEEPNVHLVNEEGQPLSPDQKKEVALTAGLLWERWKMFTFIITEKKEQDSLNPDDPDRQAKFEAHEQNIQRALKKIQLMGQQLPPDAAMASVRKYIRKVVEDYINPGLNKIALEEDTPVNINMRNPRLLIKYFRDIHIHAAYSKKDTLDPLYVKIKGLLKKHFKKIDALVLLRITKNLGILERQIPIEKGKTKVKIGDKLGTVISVENPDHPNRTYSIHIEDDGDKVVKGLGIDQVFILTDKAMIKPDIWHQGGIDLNTSSGMQWKVSKDGRGVEMNIDPAMIARVRREGIDSLTPVVFRITPITSIWSFVGLQAPK